MADRMSSESVSDMDRLKADLSKLREDFGELFDAALEVGKNRAGTAKEKLDAGIQELKRAAALAKERGSEAVEVAQHKIAERPLTSVFIAFGVGMLIGALVKRR